jgi:hypothetical protein
MIDCPSPPDAHKAWPYDEIMRPVTFEMAQEAHADAENSMEDAELTVRRCNSGGGPGEYYIAIRLTGEWAFDDAADVDAFCEKIKSCLP